MSNELIAIIGLAVSMLAVVLPLLIVVVFKLGDLAERVAKLETEMSDIKGAVKQAVTEVLVECGVLTPERTIETASLQTDTDS